MSIEGAIILNLNFSYFNINGILGSLYFLYYFKFSQFYSLEGSKSPQRKVKYTWIIFLRIRSLSD